MGQSMPSQEISPMWQFLRPVRFIQVWKIPLALLLQVVSTFGLSLPHFCTLQMHLDPDFEYLTLW